MIEVRLTKSLMYSGLGTEVLYHAVRKFDRHLQRKVELSANI